jgi:hypothetical protein
MKLGEECNQSNLPTQTNSARWSCALPLIILIAQAVVLYLFISLVGPSNNERSSFVHFVSAIVWFFVLLLPAACGYGLYLGFVGLRLGDAFLWCALGIGLNLAYLFLIVPIWFMTFMFFITPIELHL